MKKKILLALSVALILVCTLALSVGAKTVYLEEIPQELKMENDAFTHFVVFEEEIYFSGSNGTIEALNKDQMEADMASFGIDKSKIGSEYLTRYNFPQYMGETLVTYVNLNAIKGTTYFSNVCGYIQLYGTVEQIHDMRSNCNQIRCIDFGENSQIANIPSYFCEGASRLKAVKNFPKNLDNVYESAFNGCYCAFSGELYVNATRIHSNAFNNAIANVTTITFGPKVTTIDTQAFTVRMAELSAEAKPTDSKIQITRISFECDVTQMTINSNAFYFGGTWARSSYSKLETIELLNLANEKAYVEGNVFNDFTTTDIFFDGTDGSEDFVTVYHDFVIPGKIVYTSFFEKGEKQVLCECGAHTGTETLPIFVEWGYTVAQYGQGSVMQGFVVNEKALSDYNDANKDAQIADFGVIAGTSLALGETTDVFAENGELATNKVAQKSFMNQGFAIFEMKISGFNQTVDVNGTPLDLTTIGIYNCGYYLIKKGESYESYYMDQGSVTEILPEAFTFASKI